MADAAVMRPLLGVGLAFLGVAMGSYVGLGLLLRPRPDLERVLSRYRARLGAAGEASKGEKAIGVARVKRVKRAAGAPRASLGASPVVALDQLLESADVPVSGSEALRFGTPAAAVLVVLAFVLSRSVVVGAAAVIGVPMVPVAFLRLRAARRRRQFTSDLPDTLQLLAGSLRGGYSFFQAIAMVSEQRSGPIGAELRRVVAEARLGRSPEEALRAAAQRMNSADLEWVVMAVSIQRELGGNLAEVLSTVQETMVLRQRLRREVRALTAEGRVSAYVLGGLPIALGLVLYAMNPHYMGVLFRTGMGQAMVIGSSVAAVFGFFWMKKIAAIES